MSIRTGRIGQPSSLPASYPLTFIVQKSRSKKMKMNGSLCSLSLSEVLEPGSRAHFSSILQSALRHVRHQHDGPQTPTPPEEARHCHPAPWRRSAQRTRRSDEAIPRSLASKVYGPTSDPPRNAASISDCSEDSAVSSCDWQDRCRPGHLQSSAAMFADCLACLSTAAKDK